MHELDGDGALAYGRGAALDRAVADVASDEDAGDAGLEQVGVAIELPHVFGVRLQIRPGEDEALGIAGDAGGQPARLGLGADEDEDRAGRTLEFAIRTSQRE